MAVVIAFFLSLLQTPVQPPPRDARPSPPAGTGILRGVVVDEPTGAPIAGARVTVTSAGAGFDRRTGPSFVAETSASNDGRFEILGLPAGEYLVTADPGPFRASHLRRVLGHDDGPGASLWRRSLELAPGEVKADIKLALPRAFAVEGRVIDELGDPMADVSVTARSEGGLAFAGQAVSDDRGRFRLYGMPAGQYTVCAQPHRGWRGGPAPDGVSTRNDEACLNGLTLAKGDQTPSIQLQPQRVGTFTLSGTVVSSTGADVTNAHAILFGLDPEGIKSDRELAIALERALAISGRVVARISPRNSTVIQDTLSTWKSYMGGAGRSAANGSYRLRNFVPGDYLVLAVSEGDQKEIQGTDRLRPNPYERFATLAERVSLLENDRRVIDLRVTQIPQEWKR